MSPREPGADDRDDEADTDGAVDGAPEDQADAQVDSRTRRPLDDASVDAAFADIVAMWRADAGREGRRIEGAASDDPGPVRADPSVGADPGDIDPDAALDEAPPAQAPPDRSSPDRSSADRSSPDKAARDSAAMEEIFAARRSRIEREVDAAVDGPGGGHYVPPEPAPLPQLDLFTVLAWAGVLLGPVLIVVGAFTGGLIPRWVIGAAVAAAIGGFVLLVARLPRRGEADPEDDGAVV